MVTEDLIIYISSQLKKNISKETITSKLLAGGWRPEDIEEGFIKITPPTVDIKNESHTEVSPSPEEKPKQEEFKKETTEEEQELLPTLIPKNPPVDTIDQKKETPVVKEEILNKENELKQTEIAPKKDFFDKNKSVQFDLPKIAVMPTIKDEIVINKKNDNTELPPENHSKINKWWIIIIIVVLVIGAGLIFASTKGYLGLGSLIKKDPQALFLDSQNKIDKFAYYKVDDNVNISFPSFANITNGLVGGEIVKSNDNDQIDIKSEGMVDHSAQNKLSKSVITTTKSFSGDTIKTDIETDNLNIYLSASDVAEIFKEETSLDGVVLIPKDKIDLYIKEFPETIKDKIKIFSLSKIAQNAPFGFSESTVAFLKGYIEGAEFKEKEDEKIKDIDTYHYEINANRQANKKLLANLVGVFTRGDTVGEDLIKLDKFLGSVTVNSFEFWVGKKDNIIYRYKISLSVPLSQVIGLEDKGIDGDTIQVVLQRTYYDFGVQNKILLPKVTLPISDYYKDAHKTNLKNEVASLLVPAELLFKNEKSYGQQTNKNGSCLNPVSGSFFSPLGHSKNSVQTIADISKILNSIFEQTKGNGLCYSTSKAWAISIPILDNYNSLPKPEDEQSFFCVDNTGAKEILTTNITGPVCK